VANARDAQAVRRLFDGIAGRYDLVNTVLSFGTDGGWRRAAAAACALAPGASALDVACGTGRLTEELARAAGAQGRVVGVDFSPRMLQEARRRRPKLEWVEGDALSLPFPRASFDAATIAFGLRNLARPERGLVEMARVVRPGGRLVVLEFLRPPRGPMGAAYRWYLTRVLPSVGGWLSGDRPAYRYLADTVESYLSAEELTVLGLSAGWREPRLARLNLGTIALLVGHA
jgi:demethylmenaquinone methyltransferase/2-methoxy-6-polyprenyl-1,4-benzoquinol methylase